MSRCGSRVKLFMHTNIQYDVLDDHHYQVRWFRPPDPAGSWRKDAWNWPYPAGKHQKSLEHGSSIPARNFSEFFRWIPANFLCFPTGIGRKTLEKIRKFSGRNTASTKSPELPGTGRFLAGMFDLGTLCKCMRSRIKNNWIHFLKLPIIF